MNTRVDVGEADVANLNVQAWGQDQAVEVVINWAPGESFEVAIPATDPEALLRVADAFHHVGYQIAQLSAQVARGRQ